MFKHLLDLFFPEVCNGCKSILMPHEKIICTYCRHNAPLTNHHLIKENEAFKKFYGRIPIEHASAFLYFHKKGIVQELIHNLKYKGRQEIGTLLGSWYSQNLKDTLRHLEAHEIIPVPLHKKKYRERGYNQVTTFGKILSEDLNLKFNDTLLFRKKYSSTQSKKNLLGRTESIEDLFEVCYSDTDHNKHFILVDDVITTGATLEACSKAILKIPGSKVSIVCMAIAQS